MATPVSLVPPPALAHASVVGTSFVNQYYMCLQSSPRLLYRFYMDHSHLTLAPSRDATSVTVNTHDKINRQISGLHYDHCKAVIASVDSQYTAGNGVLVQVTGTIATAASQQQPRPFVQSFVLAPQEKGYYVLNDIIRYTDAAPHPTTTPAAPPTAAPPAALAQASAMPPQAVAAPHPPAATPAAPPASVAAPPQAAPAAAAAPHTQQQRQQPAPSAVPAAAAPAPAQQPSASQPPALAGAPAAAGAADAASREASAPVDDAGASGEGEDAESDAAGGKLSYADMTKKKNALQARAVAAAAASAAASAASGASSGAGARAPLAAGVGAAATPSGEANGSAAAPSAPSSNGGALGGGAGRERLAGVPGGGPKYDYCSVFVRNVPGSFDEAKLRDALAHFGRVKELSLKPQKGAHDGQKIAFIDFDSPEAASAVIAANLVLENHPLAVELKKISPPGGAGRGMGRGDPQGGMGRGPPGAGRGLGPRSGPPRGSGLPTHHGVNGDGPGDGAGGERGPRTGTGRGYGAAPGGGFGRGGGRGDTAPGFGRGPGRPTGPAGGTAAAAPPAGSSSAPPAPRAGSATPAPRPAPGAKA